MRTHVVTGVAQTDDEYMRAMRAWAQPTRSSMSKHAEFQDKQIEAARALVAFDARVAAAVADGEEPSPTQVKNERARLVAAVRLADQGAVDAFAEHVKEGEQTARALRAKADVAVDPATRLADIEERKMLVESGTDGATFLRQASDMLAAGQVERARFLVSVAEAKHADAAVVHAVSAAVSDAMDKTNPDRVKAREIEDALDREADKFGIQRAQILAASVGVSIDGSAGIAAGGQRAVADVSAKMADYLSRTSRGEAYSAPIGDGSNTAIDEANMARATNPRLAAQDRFESGLS